MAIVGGGCAGLAAAWQLAKQQQFDIHIYEKSWCLGGKGASLRDADGRILEHGLHIWLGFYENAFRMMRDCYQEVTTNGWGPAAAPGGRLAHGRIEDAFVPEPHVGVAHPDAHGHWAAWSGLFPPEPGLPGTLLDAQSNPFTLANYLLRCLSLLRTLLLSVIAPPGAPPPGAARTEQRSRIDELQDLDFDADPADSATAVIERVSRLLRTGSLTGAAVLMQAVAALELWLRQLDFAPQASGSALKLAEAVAAQARKLLGDVVAIDPELRTKTAVIDIVVTIAIGLFRDRVLFSDKGLDEINGFDYREWLRKHGASETAVQSGFLTGIYDLVFAYEDGRKDQARLAAGVAVRGALRMFFTYRGAMFWRMPGGMGDAMFAPLYKALLTRGTDAPDASRVFFHFRHELQTVEFDGPPDAPSVRQLTFKTFGPPDSLDAYGAAALDARGSWPVGPRLFAVEHRLDLRRGEHFDCVILALSVDGVRQTCDAALHGTTGGTRLPAAWAAMSEQVKTVATKSAQVWLRQDTAGLGWERGAGLFTALGLSFGTWADMTPTLAAERAWRGGRPNAQDAANSVAYFCSVLPEAEVEAAVAAAALLRQLAGSLRATARAADTTTRRAQMRAVIAGIELPASHRGFIDRTLSGLLQAVAAAGTAATPEMLIERVEAVAAALERAASVDAELTALLADGMRAIWPAAFADGDDARRLEVSRHVQINAAGSARYTLSLPGSIGYRISPLDPAVVNMAVAGDWTACGLDAGCVEAAVMSGMLAAHALSGQPALRSIVGYDHP